MNPNNIKIEIDGEHKRASIVMSKKVWIVSLVVVSLTSILILSARLSCNKDGVSCSTVPKYGEKQ